MISIGSKIGDRLMWTKIVRISTKDAVKLGSFSFEDGKILKDSTETIQLLRGDATDVNSTSMDHTNSYE